MALTASLPDSIQDPSALIAQATISIVNPSPTIAQVSPSTIPRGSSDVQVTISGVGFNPISKVIVANQSIQSSFVDTQHLTATVPASFSANAGQLTAVVSNPTPGGGSSNLEQVAVLNPQPIVGQISPQAISAGSSDFSVTLTGGGFLADSHVSLNGQMLASKLVGSSTLAVIIPGSNLVSGGTLSLTVSNDSPGGGLSLSPVLTVLNPVPVVAQISPQSVSAGSPDLRLTLTGSGFQSNSHVTLNGQVLASNLSDSSTLSVLVPSSSLLSGGTLSFRVSNDSPGGGISGSPALTVLNPAPVVTQISPPSVNVGSPDLKLTLSGAGFQPTSHVSLNGQLLTSALWNPSSLSVVVPSSSFMSVGTLLFTVSNDSPGGGSSISPPLSVLNPAPVVIQLSPQSSTAGSPDLKVTLIGSGFQASSQVSLNGQVLKSTLSDSSTLSVIIPSSNLISGGTLLFSVANDPPGGGSSISPAFTVFNPVPVATSVSPAAVFTGTEQINVTISGSGFLPGSLVSANSQMLTTTFLSTTQLQVSLPNSLFANSGQVSLIISNSAPGGGASLPIGLTVLANGQVVSTGNPQVASYFVTALDGAQVNVGFGEQDYSLNTSSIKAPNGGGQVRVLVAGMKPNTEYHMRATMSLSDGSVISDIDHVFQSGSLPANELPTLMVTRTGLGEESHGVQLFDDFDFSNRISLFATDRDGNIIWTYPRSATEGAYQPAKLLDDGDIIVNTTVEIREFNLAGETTKYFGLDNVNAVVSAAGYDVPISQLHHDLQKLPNGHYILLGNTHKSVILNGQDSPTVLLGDVIIDLDPNLNVAWFWNSFDHLDVNRRSPDPGGFTAPNDWTHSNAILYLPQDGNLLISMRHQSWILKIDYEDGKGTGDVLWKLGWQGDFSLTGDPSQWFYFQHYPNVLSDDGTNMRIGVFDNGDNRILDSQEHICGTAGQPGCYSRSLIIDIDQQAKTAAIEFQSNLGLFSVWGGSAQVSTSGNFLAGITVTETGGRAEEITTKDPSGVIWQLDVLGQNAYRSLRIPSLYPGVEWP